LLLYYIRKNKAEAKEIEIIEPWARAAKAGMNTAVYMKIKNNSNVSDTLISVECQIAEISEIHEAFKRGEKMGMRKIDYLEIPANFSQELKPKSTHIMLIKLKDDIQDKNYIELNLNFKRNGKIKIQSAVMKMK